MSVRFHPEAEEDLTAAIDYYEGCEAGLGEDFALEVAAVLRNVASFPLAWPVVEDGMRRCLINRFPYALLYDIEDNGIHVYAVGHLSRQPGYWRHRR